VITRQPPRMSPPRPPVPCGCLLAPRWVLGPSRRPNSLSNMRGDSTSLFIFLCVMLFLASTATAWGAVAKTAQRRRGKTGRSHREMLRRSTAHPPRAGARTPQRKPHTPPHTPAPAVGPTERWRRGARAPPSTYSHCETSPPLMHSACTYRQKSILSGCVVPSAPSATQSTCAA
jgi:hypothetical protein